MKISLKIRYEEEDEIVASSDRLVTDDIFSFKKNFKLFDFKFNQKISNKNDL